MEPSAIAGAAGAPEDDEMLKECSDIVVLLLVNITQRRDTADDLSIDRS